MYVMVGMILPVLVEIEIIREVEKEKLEFVPKHIGKHDALKPYSDAELEPT